MNVLFLMIAFPDLENNPNQYTDLACEFVKNGHDVYVTTVLEKKYKKETTFRKELNIKVLRVKCGDLFNVGFIKKGISTVTITNKFIIAIKKYFHDIKFDLIIYPTPPITFFKIVKYIKKTHNCKSYLILRDIFPQNARDVGVMTSNLLFKYFGRIEKSLYNISDYIGCMSEKNIEYILSHNNISKIKCELLPNWKKIKKITLRDTINYRKKYGLNNKFTAIFGGVIGIAQELEFLLELAKIYRGRDDIKFLIIGEGNQKKKLKEIINKEKLSNVIMKERIPSSEFYGLVRQCDIGLVNLNRNFTIPNFPSKTLAYFEAGIPVLASIDKNTDHGKFLEAAKAGYWSVTGDIDTYRQNFERLLNNKELRKEFGKNGRNFLEKNLTVEKTYSTIIKHFI